MEKIDIPHAIDSKMELEPPVLKKSFAELEFVNTIVKSLPIEENALNKRHIVTGYNYSKVQPTPRSNPRIVSLSKPALELLDLDYEAVQNDPDTPLYLTGNKLPSNSQPIANCYCGHQFGVFAGQLGDGRAITLGDIRNHKGELWELQYKGSGLTPYSRFADGKAVLRSSIREYLCSEALWALGIPTTRAAGMVVTDDVADRDPTESGRVIQEKCAVVLRLAPSFFRFGSFEIFKPTDPYSGDSGSSHGLEKEMMPAMLEFMLNYFPQVKQLEKEKGLSKDETYLEMFRASVLETARVVALWQCYGFCHGVLNTDNMSVLGLTIDFGPFGWMDYFNKKFICNHSDQHGRYSYENQPEIGKWNLIKFAEALQSHLPLDKTKEIVEKEYYPAFEEHYYAKMREKLGLFLNKDEDKQLIDELFDVMHENASDMTTTFRKLTIVGVSENPEEAINETIVQEFAALSPSKDTLALRYAPDYTENQIQRIKQLAQTNMQLLMVMGFSPKIIEEQEEKIKQQKKIMELSEEQMAKDIQGRWEKWLKKYHERVVLEAKTAVEESKFESAEEFEAFRMKKMNSVNPVYVIRNYMAEEVIRKAEKGDYSGVNNLLELLLNPFEENDQTYEGKRYTSLPPQWALKLCVSCSS